MPWSFSQYKFVPGVCVVMRTFYRLVKRTVVPVGIDEFMNLGVGEVGHRVALSRLADCEVSTVFLSINYNFLGGDYPILFETMIFGGKYDRSCHRYPGWKNYAINFPRFVNYSILITIPGWYLAWFGHWATVLKLMWENFRGENGENN